MLLANLAEWEGFEPSVLAVILEKCLFLRDNFGWYGVLHTPLYTPRSFCARAAFRLGKPLQKVCDGDGKPVALLLSEGQIQALAYAPRRREILGGIGHITPSDKDPHLGAARAGRTDPETLGKECAWC